MLTNIDLKVVYLFDVQSIRAFLACLTDLSTALPKLDTINVRLEMCETDVRS